MIRNQLNPCQSRANMIDRQRALAMQRRVKGWCIAPSPRRLDVIPLRTPTMKHLSPVEWQASRRSATDKARPARPASSAQASAVTASLYSSGASLVLTHSPANVEVHVFGVEHTEAQPNIAEFILQTRPQVVFVETSVCPDHGSCPGAVLSCRDQVVGSAAGFVRMLCQTAAQVSDMGPGVVKTPLWEQMCAFFPAEQLAYIAAFATGARLVHCDRPKDITIRRLATMCATRDLDAAFEAQCVTNFRDHVGLPPLPRDFEHPLLVHRILMLEREAVMCAVMHDQLSGDAGHESSSPPGPQAGSPGAVRVFQDFTPADESAAGQSTGGRQPVGGSTKLLVAVVGSGHVEGLRHLWETRQWRELLHSTDLLCSPLMMVPPPGEQRAGRTGPESPLFLDHVVPGVSDEDGSSVAAVGLRRGLLDAFLRTCASSDELSEVEDVLGPVTPQQYPAYDAVTEVYGTSRMLLAMLPRDLLEHVCCGWKCDMYEVLQPLRDIRPINGGTGYSDELIAELRSLNFEL